jgi:peptidoglycan/xylan/chitin deacetylase (PgdA/CDA1 family)
LPQPDRELGRFAARCHISALMLRRLLEAVDVPPRWLVGCRLVFGASPRQSKFELFLRRYAYWRGVRHGLDDRQSWKRMQRGPVILMYHAIGRTASEGGSCFVVSRAKFQRQMAWLKWRGYRVLSLRDLIAHREANQLPPARSVVITFDDGYADNYDVALPILRRYGFPATVFVVSDSVGQSATWVSDEALRGRPLLSGRQLAEMANCGIEIGAHTRTHPSLPTLPAEHQESELRGSRAALEQQLGQAVLTFAYPFGDYDAAVAARVGVAGFIGACCSRSGVNDPSTPPFELRRAEVRGTESFFAYAVMLWRGYRASRPKGSAQLEHATT